MPHALFNPAAYQRIQAEIQALCPQAPPALIAITKYGTVDLVRQCVEAGVLDIGENRVADAIDKQNTLLAQLGERAKGVRWHFVGHLQRKKAAKTVGRFALIHTVDTLPLAEKLSEVNLAAHLCQPVLLQVNIAQEPQKHGFMADELANNFAELLPLKGISLQGLMCMAPFDADETTLHAVFGGLTSLRDQLQAMHDIALPQLSMGMSDDYPIALQHGATYLRLGRSLLNS